MVNGTPDWDGYYLSAYGIAVKHGFQGSEEEWLASLGLPARVAAELANAAAQSANTAAGLANEAATAANTAAQGVEDVIDGAIESFSEQAQAAKTAAEAAQTAAASAKNSVEEALAVAEELEAKGELAQIAAAAANAAAQNANEKAQAAVEAADGLSTVKAATEAATTAANTAAAAANASKAAADEAVAAADAAASAANAAATNAQTQGNYAKSQGDRAAALIETIQDADVGSLAAEILDLQDSITALEAGKLDKSGGALTGNLTAGEITGAKLQTTGAEKLSEAAQKVAVLDSSGRIAYRTPTELRGDLGAVPLTRTVNGKALSADIALTSSDVGAVPVTRTVNGKALSADITLTAEDVGAQALRNGVAVTIPAGESAWGTDSTQEYSRYWDLAVSGLTARDRADVMIAPTSFAAAKECGLCPGSETFAGKIRLRAKTAPASAIAAEYWIEKGMV